MAREGETELNPFDVGQITERLPAWELYEDGVEPDEEPSDDLDLDRDRAA